MRAMWLIDGSYIYWSAKSYQSANPSYQNMSIDYLKLKKELIKTFSFTAMDSFYFNSTPDPAADAQNSFHSWLKSPEASGGPNIRVKLYSIKEKWPECPKCKERFPVKVQKGVDIGIATIALRFYQKYDALVFSTGDGDFEDAIRFLAEDNDKKVFIAGFDGSISPDIMQFSSDVYFLNKHYHDICDTRYFTPFEATDIAE